MTFEIVTAQHYWKRIRFLTFVTAPFALLGLLNAYHSFTGDSHDGTMMGFMMLIVAAMIGSGPLILLVARRFWVQRFDAQGVVLRNGRRFLWKDFQRCQKRLFQRYRTVNNYELVFTTGTAGVYHRMAENYGELLAILEQLEAGKNPFAS